MVSPTTPDACRGLRLAFVGWPPEVVRIVVTEAMGQSELHDLVAHWLTSDEATGDPPPLDASTVLRLAQAAAKRVN